MSKRSDLVYLGTLLDDARRAAEKARNATREQFDNDDNLRMALTWLLQNVSEAASKVPLSVREAQPQIDWSSIVTMRDRLVDDYFRIDAQKVWEAATEHMPR